MQPDAREVRDGTDVAMTVGWRRPRAAEALPLVVLLAVVAVRELRPLAPLALAAGLLLSLRSADAGRNGSSAAWAWGAALPLSLSLAWGTLGAPQPPPGVAGCADPLSPFALWRLAEAAIALGALALVARRLRADRASLSLRWPGPTTVVLACAGAVAAGPLALVLSAAVAAPFFGGFRLELGLAGAIVPALVFSASNGAMEELLYRGALQGWAARAIGRSGAFVFQAAVFGFAHAGPDFVASPAPVVLALTAAAMLAGLIVWRTRSLLLPIAVHAAFDIPIYYYFACRVG
ncbi:MAG: hypothetical protein A2X23_02870 [Chloroflexi bacterium GWC2_73_18]|nr:MAG: hypothetical protein A2X23_02870 [Chloroflexi bacterium GWC2_73_18]